MQSNTTAAQVTESAFTTKPNNDEIATAWATFKETYPLLQAAYRETNKPYQDAHPLSVQCDTCDEIMSSNPAHSIQTVAMKLRRAFMNYVPDNWAASLAMGEDTPENRQKLGMDDMWPQMLWSAIDDLDRLAREG